MSNRFFLLLFLAALFAGNAQAQKREEVYQQIDQLLDQGKWAEARAKAKEMAGDDDWSAIPPYQIARSYHLELKTKTHFDTAEHRILSQTASGYLGKMIELLPERKSIRKDAEDYWLPLVQDSTEELEDQVIVNKAMQLGREMQALNEQFIEEAGMNRAMLEELSRVYLICQDSLLKFQAENDEIEEFYLKATPQQRNSLRSTQQRGEQLKMVLLAYEKIWEQFEVLPETNKQAFEWKTINPNARNYYRFDEEDFRESTVTLYDFSQWAGALADKLYEIHSLAEEAETLYKRFDLYDSWTRKDLEQAEVMLQGWVEKMENYGSVGGTRHVLETLLEKGEYQAAKARFLKKDQSAYLHKNLRDKMLDRLIYKLDTLNGFAASVFPNIKSYAYQEAFFQLLLDGGRQPVALRNKITQYVADEKADLEVMKIASVHLPPELPDSIIDEDKVIWLRPGKRNPEELYEQGAYIVESVREGAGGVAIKGRRKTENGPVPFMSYITLENEIVWWKEYSEAQGTEILAEGMEVDLDRRVFYYQRHPDGKYTLEAVDAKEGRELFKFEVDRMPLKQLFHKSESIWVVWEQRRTDDGLAVYKIAQLDYKGQMLKEAELGLEGNICGIILYDQGMHIVGNYRRFIDWKGEEHKSEATRGHGTNVFVATLSTPELTRQRLITAPISLFANMAMFNPEANQLRMMGYKGEFQIDEAKGGKAKGGTQWQEYINP